MRQRLYEVFSEYKAKLAELERLKLSVYVEAMRDNHSAVVTLRDEIRTLESDIDFFIQQFVELYDGVEINLPAPVTNLAAEVTETEIRLTWDASEHATSYYLEFDGVAYVAETNEYVFTNLEPDTEYAVAIQAENEHGESDWLHASFRTAEPVQPPTNLLYDLYLGDSQGYTGSIVEDNSGILSNLVGVVHDGTDGFINERGIILKPNAYIDIPASVGQQIDLNTKGATFVLCADLSDKTNFFRSTDAALFAYFGGIVATARFKYKTPTGEVKTFSSDHTTFTRGTLRTSFKDALNPAGELDMVVFRFYPDGSSDITINGASSLTKNKPTDFLSYDSVSMFSNPIQIRRNNLGLNVGNLNVRAFQIVNEPLTNEAIAIAYDAAKGSEPLYAVEVHPQEVNLNIGDIRNLFVQTRPVRYASLLSNEFDSGNYGFVSVNAQGTLQGIDEGSTLVLVKSTLGNEVYENYVSVNVGSNVVPPPQSARTIEGIALNRVVRDLEVGQLAPVMATTLPFDVFNDNIVVWESSSPSVCTVRYGVLEGISEGTAIITAYDSTRQFSVSFGVTVSLPQEDPAESYFATINSATPTTTTESIASALESAKLLGYGKVVFPYGEYWITPEAGTILLPSNLIIDFSNSVIRIAPNSLSPVGYNMFQFLDSRYTRFKNAIIYGEADHIANIANGHEKCVTFEFSGDCYRSGLYNCTISKSAGFNISAHNKRGTDQAGRHPSKNDFVAGGISSIDGTDDDSVLTNIFRTNRFLNVSLLGDSYNLGYSQGYFGYPHLRSRLYSIYFYDAGYNFIKAHTYNLQFYPYETPFEAEYAKIVIYQENVPTSGDTDFNNAVAFLRTWKMPVECYIENCIIEDNTSCGIAVTGGHTWNIKGNKFARNGKRMPACDIDWEDGWDLSVADVLRNNEFNSTNGVILSGCHSLVMYQNTFNFSHLYAWGRSANYRIYDNYFNGKSGGSRNITLETSADSYFASNRLRNVGYTKKLQHTGASYQIRDENNITLG